MEDRDRLSFLWPKGTYDPQLPTGPYRLKSSRCQDPYVQLFSQFVNWNGFMKL